MRRGVGKTLAINLGEAIDTATSHIEGALDNMGSQGAVAAGQGADSLGAMLTLAEAAREQQRQVLTGEYICKHGFDGALMKPKRFTAVIGELMHVYKQGSTRSQFCRCLAGVLFGLVVVGSGVRTCELVGW